MEGCCVHDKKLLQRVCMCMQAAATTLDSVTHLSELSLRDNMSPVVPSQLEVPPCASSHGRTSGGSTARHSAASSRGTYSSDTTSPSKKRKTGVPAEQVQLWSDFKEFPELQQAALGQWPPRHEQEPAAGPVIIGQLSDLPQVQSADASDDLPIEHKFPES